MLRAKIFTLMVMLFAFSSNSFADGLITPKKIYTTQRLSGNSPTIDGQLDETSWKNAQWEGGFIQHEPFEGRTPSQNTKFAVMYNDEYIYVAIKAFDNSTDSINRRMTRRDEIDGDQVGIQFDSYHDLRTAFTFVVSAAGVKEDYLMSNDGESEDKNWDPIWWVKTSMTKDGWQAEMKIPLTQLRFDNKAEHVWGFQVARVLFRKNEFSLWQPIARDASGWVNHLGELHGVKNIKPQKVFDITPYTLAKSENYLAEEGNPYATGTDYGFNAGVDGKIGLTNNLTLDFTVNPDFGQVEADPSEVNLTAYESFFEEKRPFFIEGRNILSFPLMFGDGDLAAQNLFYSRRVGRRPHHYLDLADNEYADMPEFTKILAAAKITGKTSNGWSIGLLESLASEENAEISQLSTTRDELVEPSTNYTVARIQKDIDGGNSIIGGMLTSTNRRLDNTNLTYLHKNAFTSGVDYTQFFKEKTWFFKASGMYSNVQGDSTAILETQMSSARYFQRPDADYLTLDSNLTELSGFSTNLQFGKIGGGKLKFLAAISAKSPGFEVNDIGFLPETDEIMEILWVGYRIYEPFSIFRSLNINVNQWSGWNFGGTNTFNGGNINLNTEFKNYWNLSMGTNVNGNQVSNGILRGGPSIKNPGSFNFWFWMGTNNQKKIRISTSFSINDGFEDYYDRKSVNLSLTYRPTNTLELRLSPSYSTTLRKLQYVDLLSYQSDDRYVFATLDQKVWNLSLRINYNIKPELSIQYWGQPFVAAGKYLDFKYISNPQADKFTNRFIEYSENQLSFNPDAPEYNVDENMDGTDDYYIYYPDFNFKEFLSNLVIRWEYTPGSTVYLVWSQTRDHFIDNGDFNMIQDNSDLFNRVPYNVFMVKFSYRIAL